MIWNMPILRLGNDAFRRRYFREKMFFLLFEAAIFPFGLRMMEFADFPRFILYLRKLEKQPLEV